MRSFVDHGHAFHLYSYSPQIDVPPGVEIKDAAEFFEPKAYFTYKGGASAGSHAAFSNLFRYKLLVQRGGWWVDTDVVCLSSAIPHFEEFFAYEANGIVNGAVLFFRRQDALILECLAEAQKIGDSPKWGEIGPRLISRKAKAMGRIDAAQPMVTCYPIHYSEAIDLLRPAHAPSIRKQTQDSFLLHLWNEKLRRLRVSKAMLPPKGSFLRAIAERHPVAGWSGEYNEEVLEQTVLLEAELHLLRKEIKTLSKQRWRRGLQALIPKTKLATRFKAAENALAAFARSFRS